MRPEDKLLFACARQTFLPAHQQTVLDIARHSPLNWASVYSTALAHGVAPLVYANLRQCANLGLSLPKEVLGHFQDCFFHNMASKEDRAEILREALAFFCEKSIAVMLIKGVALDMLVYDHPYYTMPQDVDIVLKTKREDLPQEDVASVQKCEQAYNMIRD